MPDAVTEFHKQVSSYLLQGVQEMRTAGYPHPHPGKEYVEVSAPHLLMALEELDRFFDLDSCLLLVRDSRRVDRIVVFGATAAKTTLFLHEQFSAGSQFLRDVASQTTIRALPLERKRYKGDRLWEFLWQTMYFGPYAAPWTLVGLPFFPKYDEARPPATPRELEHEVIGCLVLIGPQGWWEMPKGGQTAESLELLANGFQFAIELMQTMYQLEEVRSNVLSEFIERIAPSGPRIVLHGVLAPLQRLEQDIFLAESDFNRGERHKIDNRLVDVRAEVAEIKQFIKTFLEVSTAGQTGEETSPSQQQWTDAEETILTILRGFENLAQARGKTIVARVASIPTIPMKRDQFETIISNLLHNAIKYGYHNTKIKIEYTLSLPYLHLDVTSYGIPIPKDDWERIFDLGYRTAAACRMEYSATGIGLFEARRAAQLAHASLVVRASEFEETTSEGAKHRNTFRFSIRMKR